ncbi:MAG: hypothetical protein ACREM3_13395 [Candidatus Rokuibacteriota bacterium]
MALFAARSMSLDAPVDSLDPRPSGITLWRPEIVLPEGVVLTERLRVTIAEPAQRPEAVRAQMDATRSLLTSLAEARATLADRATASEARALGAGSERNRVAAMIETYRVKTALEDVLHGTIRQMSALMGERGRR